MEAKGGETWVVSVDRPLLVRRRSSERPLAEAFPRGGEGFFLRYHSRRLTHKKIFYYKLFFYAVAVRVLAFAGFSVSRGRGPMTLARELHKSISWPQCFY